ncbi:MAG: exopolysaccharide biosynthesis polyprenyl glycosylphosphotransferase [Mesorhizobium sp.]|uniref:exopolysaccharide biosynthesis polyprenyl glycosylphosphotransferase n=1 Tax=Mesorhizobium sp. TaxID=1871066 RepID=UPI000FE614E6|nr:exopolysaccharide biosynthesis polyprenyl glycosylphosphotransferase [Mesorhizobium sp.]RWC35151.1 MAG: exopolysaccharide biosynthesis polyprenyl glycosylphosphotransferase [Mesorhizobium sp.]
MLSEAARTNLDAPVPNIGSRRHWLLRIRVQLLGGLLVAIVLPAAIRSSVDPRVLLSSNQQATMIAAAIAHIVGFFAYRRMGNFPGVAAASYILPTFAMSYGAVLVMIFFFRFDYSRFQAIGSFLLSVSWYFGLSLATRRLGPYRLAIIPGGEVDRIETVGGVNWRRLASPSDALERISGVVADLRADLSADWERYIANSALSGVPVYHVKQISESLTGRVEIEHLSENTLGSLNPNHFYIKLKQMIDWTVALLMLLFLSPLLLITAIAIRLDSKGPAMFRQERMGYRGQVFTVFKFRSMLLDADQAGDEREKAITKSEDDRITRVGRFLRKSRIDELPQALNILRGEMSWIGPRPEAVVLSEWYENELPFYRYRHIVRPGITGWAQVNQGHVAAVDDVLEKLHYDFYYIKNFSPWLDVVIVLRTIKTMLTGFGAR